MITPYDEDYLETKQIMLGKASMKQEFKPLAKWVDETYGVKTINIVYDSIEEGRRPRLELCFEFEREKNIFLDHQGCNFDGEKQTAIREKFKQVLEEQGLYGKPYHTENLWIIYGGFEPIARTEANERITQASLDALKEELKEKDLWKISVFFAGVTFFLYTDEQVRRYENSEQRKKWADRYFDLLEPCDEFGYFKRDTFGVLLDSKENFDQNYASNWFYYYK